MDSAIVHGTHNQYHSQGESSYYAEIANSPQVKHLVETIRDDASKVHVFTLEPRAEGTKVFEREIRARLGTTASFDASSSWFHSLLFMGKFAPDEMLR